MHMYETWEALEHNCLDCHNCPLGDTRTNLVFGVGCRGAKVLFIGEGPVSYTHLTLPTKA